MSASDHRALVEKFYTAFQNRDAETMASCYADDVRFHDPAFGDLRGEQARNMWRMLIARASDDFRLDFQVLDANDVAARVKWDAHYTFTQTGRKVHNQIEANFRISNGLITEHRDAFSMHKWSSQALGMTGTLLGWTPIVKNKVQKMSRSFLDKFEAERKA